MVRGSKGCSSKPPSPQPCPWLMYSHGRYNIIQTFYSLSDGRCLKRELSDLSGKYINATFENWAVVTYYLEDTDDDDFTRNCFLLNMRSLEKIYLPTLVLPGYHACVLTSSPLESNCIVAFFSSQDQNSDVLKFWSQNQQDWVERVVDSFTHCAVCDGKIYGMIDYSCLAIVEITGNNVEVKRVNVASLPMSTIGGAITPREFLIGSSCGDIFVVRHVRFVASARRIYTIEVYKLMDTDQKMEWVKVKDIGDRVFFLNKSSSNFSCSATQTGLKRNTIYFCGQGGDKKSLYEHNLEENRLYKRLPSVDVAHDIRDVCWLRI